MRGSLGLSNSIFLNLASMNNVSNEPLVDESLVVAMHLNVYSVSTDSDVALDTVVGSGWYGFP